MRLAFLWERKWTIVFHDICFLSCGGCSKALFLPYFPTLGASSSLNKKSWKEPPSSSHTWWIKRYKELSCAIVCSRINNMSTFFVCHPFMAWCQWQTDMLLPLVANSISLPGGYSRRKLTSSSNGIILRSHPKTAKHKKQVREPQREVKTRYDKIQSSKTRLHLEGKVPTVLA